MPASIMMRRLFMRHFARWHGRAAIGGFRHGDDRRFGHFRAKKRHEANNHQTTYTGSAHDLSSLRQLTVKSKHAFHFDGLV